MLPMKRTTPRKRTKKNLYLKNLCFLLDKVHLKLRQVIYFYILTNFCHDLILLQGLPFGFDLMDLALPDRNMQVRFGLKVVGES